MAAARSPRSRQSPRSSASTSEETLTLRIEADRAGQRIDRVLAEVYPHITRSRFQKLLRDGRVTVRGKKVRSAYRVLVDDAVQVHVPSPEPLDLQPADIPVDVRFEDDYLWVIDKPAGMVVHPAAGNRSDTLVQALLHREPNLAGGDPLRPGIVHRLDKDTSGLLVVAKNESVHAALSAQLQRREIHRQYLAVVWGHFTTRAGTIEGAIGRHPVDRKRMAVRSTGGKPARTHYEVVEEYAYATLLRVQLESGRTHQIRVHLSWKQHPVFGDPVYHGRNSCLTGLRAELRVDAREALKSLSRQALHASKLTFRHPVTSREVIVESPLPEDLETLLARMRRSAPGVLE
jgi:23S rRNA pseudouridine1911/1915/1917 synthase